MGPPLPAILAALLVLTAGCTAPGLSPQSPTPTAEHDAYLSVTEVPADDAEAAPLDQRAAFENLPEPKRAAFERALDTNSDVPVEAWESGSTVEYVRYEGTWYRVEVHVV